MEADPIVEIAKEAVCADQKVGAWSRGALLMAEWIVRNTPIVSAAVAQEEASRELVLEYGKLPKDVKVWIATTNATEQAVRAARGKA